MGITHLASLLMLLCDILRYMDDISDEEVDNLIKNTSIEESLEPQPHGGSLKREKKVDLTALAWYGEGFAGYQKLDEVRDLIPVFKEFYYETRIKDPNSKITKMVQEFNRQIAPRKFHPYMKNISLWKAKWDKDIFEQQGMKMDKITTEKKIYQVLKTRNDDRSLAAPDDVSLEGAVRTLGGELMNDAFQMLREDQDMPEIYDDEVLIKRRNYIVGVFGHVTKLVHGKAALMLKASEEKRNNAGFLMQLLAKATAGTITADEMTLLKSNYQPAEKQNA